MGRIKEHQGALDGITHEFITSTSQFRSSVSGVGISLGGLPRQVTGERIANLFPFLSCHSSTHPVHRHWGVFLRFQSQCLHPIEAPSYLTVGPSVISPRRTTPSRSWGQVGFGFLAIKHKTEEDCLIEFFRQISTDPCNILKEQMAECGRQTMACMAELRCGRVFPSNRLPDVKPMNQGRHPPRVHYP